MPRPLKSEHDELGLVILAIAFIAERKIEGQRARKIADAQRDKYDLALHGCSCRIKAVASDLRPIPPGWQPPHGSSAGVALMTLCQRASRLSLARLAISASGSSPE